jgi:ribonuclease D
MARNRGADKNIPRGRIVKDETLADIASHPPRHQDDLGKVRGLSACGRPTTSARG